MDGIFNTTNVTKIYVQWLAIMCYIREIKEVFYYIIEYSYANSWLFDPCDIVYFLNNLNVYVSVI